MSQSLPQLPRPLVNILFNLYEAGGHANRNNRQDPKVQGGFTVGEGKHPLPGDDTAWLDLMAYGYVAGERGLVMLTEAGRAKCDQIEASRTKVATR